MRAVNLIPTDRRPGAGGPFGRSGGAAYALVALAAGIVLLAVLWLSANHTASQREAQLQSLNAQASSISAGAGSLQSYSSFVSMADGRVSAVRQLAAERFDWAHAFHELGRVLPVGISLTNVTGSIGGAAGATALAPAAPATGTTGATGSSPVQSATPSGVQPAMAVQGCATNQGLVALTVQRLALIDGVQSVDLQTSTANTASSNAGNGHGPCPYDFTVDVTFLPLPAASAAAPTTPSVAPASNVTGTTGATGATGPTSTTTTSTTGSAAR